MHRQSSSATTYGTSEDMPHTGSPALRAETLSIADDYEEIEEDEDEEDCDVVEGVPLFEQFLVVGVKPSAASEAQQSSPIEQPSMMRKFGRMLSKASDKDFHNPDGAMSAEPQVSSINAKRVPSN